MPDAVIVSTARSPIGRARKGSLRDMRPDDLAVQMVHAALERVPELDPVEIDDLILGCAQPGGEQGKNLGRVVAVLAGFDQLPATTVTRYCASSVQSTRMALHAIRSGEGHVFVSAGVETVSRFDRGSSDAIPGQDFRNNRFEAAIRRSERRATEPDVDAWTDPRGEGELPDIYVAMGQTAENVQQVLGMSRRDQDEFAVRSHNLTETRAAEGFWAREITPVTLPDGSTVSTDDCPRAGATLEAISRLEPVFRPGGTVTAGNACPLNDGAAALVVMSDEKARDLGLTPLARIRSSAVSGLSPEIMGLGPVTAIPRALGLADLTLGDVDQFEINEAFAVQALGSAWQLGIDVDKLNINGGAIALGHPFGMTGARIITTLINSLEWHDQEIGVVSMCVGGGQGMALVLERMS